MKSQRNTAETLKVRRTLLSLHIAALGLGAGFALEASAQETAQELSPVVVKGAIEDTGFRSEKATVGPLGERPILDTPYSVSVIPAELIQNQQATSLTDLLKYLPSTQMQARGGMDVGRPQSRGFQANVVESNHLDGLNVAGTTAYPMEMLERLEVINSLTGALYGPASPGGNFNFVQKRPTDTPLRRFTFGYTGKSAFSVHADIGGRIGETGAIGYRVNLLNEDGESYVKDSTIRRKLASAALDFHLSKDTVVELNASHYEFVKKGLPGGFSYAATVALPGAFDPTRAGYGQSFSGLDLETNTISTRLKHRFNDKWHVSASLGRQIVDRGMTSQSNRVNGNGTYTPSISVSVPGRFTINSYNVTLNGQAQVWGLTHDLVFGATGYAWDIYGARVASRSVLPNTSLPLNQPGVFPIQDMSTSGGTYHSGNTTQRTFLAGDTITFNPQWSVLAVGSFSEILSSSYTRTGAKTDDPTSRGFSPTVALMYKPRPNINTYISYADSLEAGGVAPDNTANEGELLSPYRSKQFEAGVKVDMHGLQAGVALFTIKRPFAYTGADNVYRTQGEQRNDGLELSLNGAVTKNISLYSGITFLNPKLGNTSSALTKDKLMVGIPKIQASALAEYRVDAVNGLVLTGNVHYTGRRAGNDTNTTWAAGYTTFDAGMRYAHNVFGKETVWRLAINNLTNKQYWASIFPGNVNGTNSAANAFLGTPREVRASVSVSF